MSAKLFLFFYFRQKNMELSFTKFFKKNLLIIGLIFLLGNLSLFGIFKYEEYKNGIVIVAQEPDGQPPVSTETCIPDSLNPIDTVLFTVFANGKSSRWIPSGYMKEGNEIIDIAKSYYYDSIREQKVIKVTSIFRKEGANWLGLAWLYPANNWGSQNKESNLSSSTDLQFWAKGENGGESVKFIIGGLVGKKFPDSDEIEVHYKLTKEWKLYSIPLAKRNLSCIKLGFSYYLEHTYVSNSSSNTITFYLDDIQYVKKKLMFE